MHVNTCAMTLTLAVFSNDTTNVDPKMFFGTTWLSIYTRVNIYEKWGLIDGDVMAVWANNDTTGETVQTHVIGRICKQTSVVNPVAKTPPPPLADSSVLTPQNTLELSPTGTRELRREAGRLTRKASVLFYVRTCAYAQGQVRTQLEVSLELCCRLSALRNGCKGRETWNLFTPRSPVKQIQKGRWRNLWQRFQKLISPTCRSSVSRATTMSWNHHT